MSRKRKKFCFFRLLSSIPGYLGKIDPTVRKFTLLNFAFGEELN